ncbi:hypothetical protein KCM76_25050 [Zooshikella marina]|uniref:hypothetical protein n=1 Tax=Zooshikella ganghwensis TaxID=202772 RepID=UPI001BAF49E2|nr:hypothetical protein [Zooshikella ganghwensis]MBU2709288.1 hypothetical protein [Zooshikella ganghwensis]
MSINKVIEEAWLTAMNDPFYLVSEKLKKLELNTSQKARVYCEVFLQTCLENQNNEKLYDFWCNFDCVSFPENFDIGSCVFNFFKNHTEEIKSDYMAFRVMDWIGSFRSKEVADYFELIFENYKHSPLYENLATGINHYLFVEYSWEAAPEDQARIRRLYEKIKASREK